MRSSEEHKGQEGVHNNGNSVLGVAFISAPSDKAEQIANRIVADRLAACAQITQEVTSIYRWQGVVHREPERLILLKTMRSLLPHIRGLLYEIHPYQVPELVFCTFQWGSTDYLAWLSESLLPADLTEKS
jgi:periplasmic divalent cation tolerance protein